MSPGPSAWIRKFWLEFFGTHEIQTHDLQFGRWRSIINPLWSFSVPAVNGHIWAFSISTNQSDSVGCAFDKYVHSGVKCGLLKRGKSLTFKFTYFPVQVSLNVDFKKERVFWRWDSNQRLSDSHHLSKIYLWGSSKRPLVIKMAKIRSSRPNLLAQASVKKSHNELLWN